MTVSRNSFPCAFREIENSWIPMPDGVRLATRIWLQLDAEANPVPAILEFVPYRKRDGMAGRDEMMHRWFAGHGYAGGALICVGRGIRKACSTTNMRRRSRRTAGHHRLAEQPA